jgi:hypothetical protein
MFVFAAGAAVGAVFGLIVGLIGQAGPPLAPVRVLEKRGRR